MPFARWQCRKHTGRGLLGLQHAADAIHDRLRFVLELFPGDSGSAVSGGDEHLITPAIALESRSGFVGFPAIGFHDQPLLLPKQVNLERMSSQLEPDVAVGPRQASFGQCGQKARLEQAPKARFSIAIRAPGG